MYSQFKATLVPYCIYPPLRSPCASLYVPNNSQHPNRLLPPSTPPPPENIIANTGNLPAYLSVADKPKRVERERSEGQVSSIADFDQTDRDMRNMSMQLWPEPVEKQFGTACKDSFYSGISNSATSSPQGRSIPNRLIHMQQKDNLLLKDNHPRSLKLIDTRLPQITKSTCKNLSKLDKMLSSLIKECKIIGVSSMLVRYGEVRYRIKFAQRHSNKVVEREIEFCSYSARRLSLLSGENLLLLFLQSKMDEMSA